MSDSPNVLPGFGRPLDYVPTEGDKDYIADLFGNALNPQTEGAELKLTTLRELNMLRLMDVITDKPDWHIKVNNEDIVNKWRGEAVASGVDVTPKMLDWCIAELRYLAAKVPEDASKAPPIVVYNGDVVKSDVAVSKELHDALNEAVDKFEESIPAFYRDWHPGSNEQVWDLVHPSLFPLVYDVSRVLETGQTTLENCISMCGQGKIAADLSTPTAASVYQELMMGGSTSFSTWANKKSAKLYSQKFQWLPCEVDITGENAKITSYINNLHPAREKVLYGLMEKLIDASIPLWQETLSPLADMDYAWANRIEYTTVLYDPDPENGPDTDGPQWNPDENGVDPNYDDEDDYWEKREEWIEETRQISMPDAPDTFKPPERPAPLDFRAKYKGLQVIVKLANIMLTPEKPEYNGGTWHVEGQLNEHIVATSLYYYSCSNITTSSLSFRQRFDAEEEFIDLYYPQNAHDWLEPVFGCQQDGPGVQEVGSVETREGRLLTFPNILQHRVGPFKLADPSKPGHRKIVALFLVDPNIKVISTAHVPCQRQDWWWEETQQTAAATTHLGGLPRELQDHVLTDVDFPLSLVEAKRLREELMEERKAFTFENGQAFEQQTISLCEH